MNILAIMMTTLMRLAAALATLISQRNFLLFHYFLVQKIQRNKKLPKKEKKKFVLHIIVKKFVGTCLGSWMDECKNRTNLIEMNMGTWEHRTTTILVWMRLRKIVHN